MSVYVMAEVWRLRMPAFAKLVLLKLADHADDEGANAYPSVERLAVTTGISRRHVQRILRDMTQRGALEVTAGPKRGRPTNYRVCVVQARSIFGLAAEAEQDDVERGDMVSPQPEVEAERGDMVSPQPQDETGGKNQNTDNAGLSETQAAAPERGDTESPQPQMGRHSEQVGVTLTPEWGDKLSHPNHPNHPQPARARPHEGGDAPVQPSGEPQGPAPAAADGDPSPSDEAAPVKAHWEASTAALKRAFGEAVWQSWFEHLIPESDDGQVLVLAAPSTFMKDYHQQRYVIRTGQVVGREVRVVYRDWCAAAYHRNHPSVAPKVPRHGRPKRRRLA